MPDEMARVQSATHVTKCEAHTNNGLSPIHVHAQNVAKNIAVNTFIAQLAATDQPAQSAKQSVQAQSGQMAQDAPVPDVPNDPAKVAYSIDPDTGAVTINDPNMTDDIKAAIDSAIAADPVTAILASNG